MIAHLALNMVHDFAGTQSEGDINLNYGSARCHPVNFWIGDLGSWRPPVFGHKKINSDASFSKMIQLLVWHGWLGTIQEG